MKIPIALTILMLFSPLSAQAQSPAPKTVQQEIQAQIQKAQAAQQAAMQEALAKRNVTRSQQAPANFPLPVYDRNVASVNYYQQTPTQGGSSVTASIQTKDSIATGYQFYSDALKRGAWVM